MTVRRFALVVSSAVPLVLASAVPLSADDTGTGVPPGVEPSADEQFGIWTLNRARHDPPKYGNEIQLDLTGVLPRPPLAVNTHLVGSARFKTKEMFDFNYFAHLSPVTGKGANQLAVDAGYDLWGMGLQHAWGGQNNIESLAGGFIDCEHAIAGLIIDADPTQMLGHRIHLLAISEFAAKFREVGMGKNSGPSAGGQTRTDYAVHTGWVNEADTFLTGVVFHDLNANGRFDAGEGIGGATINAGNGLTTQSLLAGGWSLKVPNGLYTVHCAGGTFQGVATARLVVASANREIDFASARGWGDIDFSGPMIRHVTATALPAGGMAPLGVDLRAVTDGTASDFAWTFGDGATGTGSDVHHVFNAGAWVVRVLSSDTGGVGGALTVVCADGQPTVGTTEPSTRNLKASAFTAKLDRTTPGRDKVTLTGTIEMPGGWTRGLDVASAVIAGVKADFPLVAGKDSFKEKGKRTFKLTYKHPKKGAPLKAGVKAKVQITVTGDFADLFGDLGVANRTEKRRIYSVPFIVTIGGRCFGTTATVIATTVESVSSNAAMEKQ